MLRNKSNKICARPVCKNYIIPMKEVNAAPNKWRDVLCLWIKDLT